MRAELAILILSLGSVTRDPNGHTLRWLTNVQQNPCYDQGRELPQLDPPPCRDVVCWTFYTDGTCQSPDIPAASRAAWGVIQDVYQSDDDRLNVAAGPGNGTAIPDGLLRAACGLCPGHQSPLRAELCAIWAAMQLVRVQDSDLPVNIHTDCQTAVDLLEVTRPFGPARTMYEP